MADRRQVILLLDRVGGGGIAQVVMNLAMHLDRDRFEPVVCLTREAPKMDHGRRLADAGVEVVELGRTSSTQLRPWFRLLPRLRGATIVHSHGEMTNHWARLWATAARTPILITHDHTATDEKRALSKRLDRHTAFLADAVVTVSDFDRRRTVEREGHRPDRVHVIHNGIDVDRFAPGHRSPDPTGDSAFRASLGVAPGAACVTMIARLASQKNHDLALRAIDHLRDRPGRPVHLVLVGEGPLEGPLRTAVRRLDLDEHVSFLGQRPDVPRILAATDVVLAPSRWECLPMAVLEAMAAGCAVVASPVGGVPEALDGVGWPPASGDDPEATATAIAAALAMDDAERAATVERGLIQVRSRFSAEATARATEALYDDLIGRHDG